MRMQWHDVQATIPRPLQAHNAEHGVRRVEARLWVTEEGTDTPYTLTITLWEADRRVETWEQEYRKHVTRAMSSYGEAREQAEDWLNGAALEQARPQFVKVRRG